MNTNTLPVAVLFATLIANAGYAAGHDAGRYRRLDDLAFSAVSSARELRWEIHDDFEPSRDYRSLLRDADALATEIQHITAAIWSERPDEVICQEIEVARTVLDSLAARLDRSDFAAYTHGGYRPTSSGRGYHYTPRTRHAGFVHVMAARELLAKIDMSLCAIHEELDGGHLVPFSVTPVDPLYNPNVPFPSYPRERTLPAPQVSPDQLFGPTLPAPQIRESNSTSRSRGIEVPLVGGNKGGVVLRIGK
jgi:hypothetical protein